MTSLPILQKISLRSIAAHRLRLIMTVLAVVLGTSFVSGGFILTASLSKAFDDITAASYEGSDVVLNSTPDHRLTRAMGEEIEALPGVEKVETTNIQPVVIIGPDGAPYQSGGAGSWLLPFTPQEPAMTGGVTVVEGRTPEGPTEAVVNTAAAERADISLGDTITVIDTSKRTDFEIVGLTELPTSTGGWAGVQIAEELYRTEFTDGVSTDRILVRGEISRDALAARYPGFDILTSEEASAQDSEQISSLLAFFTYILVAFGLIALLVGTFIISNTFSMIVAQRTREFALLRAIGMSRPQLTSSVLVEAAFIGVLGSVLGIGVGIGLVRLIVTAMEAFGLGFPDSGLGLDAASILAPLGVGIVVTLLSAWVPARRAGGIRPVQAMRSGEQSSTQPVGARSILGGVLAVAGVAVTVTAAFMTDWSTTTRAVLTGIGALTLILGALLLQAGLARVIFSARSPFRSVVPLLARTSLARNPRRTAATAFALTLGVALVSAVGILGASMKLSVYGSIDEEMRAQTVVSAGLLSTQGIPGQVADEISAIDEVDAVVPSLWAPLSVAGRTGTASAAGAVSNVLTVDPTLALHLEILGGDFADLTTAPGAGLSETVARELGLSVGDLVEIASPVSVASLEVPVRVIWADSSAYTPVAVTEAAAEQILPDRSSWIMQDLFVTFTDGADEAEVHEQVLSTTDPYGVLQVLTKEEYRLASAEQIDQLLALVYALLALSVIIAVLGIINTLALSIMERRREFGMLRAVGMQRSQIRRMVTIESIHIAGLGATAGIILGVWLGWCFVRALADQGITRWAIPWDQMAVVLVAAIVVGVLAAVWPARQAAATNPLEAVD
ncbi:FtsX-like permease family protein [Corynebacterium sp. YIM 101645]|uniref:FtsX-like permease family protein n=1 Tax=Corynebacterium lemuris TaxID=1859292 RepID=A0ABT2FZP7_9CORY|nr:FtsX-like permease family protein [Corynebacterium lemuris]MCS5480489.1 FtsX-like permease family protein [Corynebacterium lemuris]